MTQLISIGIVALTTLWLIGGTVAVMITVRRSRTSVMDHGEDLPPITVMKPLCGVDKNLWENLSSFCEQRYSKYQLLFGVEKADDPAVALVESLRRRYPRANITLVVRSESSAHNPKVSNLRGMMAAAKHDLVLISDSNVWAPPCYLRELVETMRGGDRVGLVTNLFAGVGESSLGAALENVQLNGFVAAGAALPTAAGDAAVVGKSMFFRRSVLERLGGLESVSDVLAEDFIIGKMFQHGGYEVRLGRTVLRSVNGDVPVRSFLNRQLRWSMLRIRLRAFAFVVEPLTSPLVMLPFALVALGTFGWAWAILLIVLRDSLQWWLLRGKKRLYLPLLLSPFRELAMLGIWLATPFVKYISWRGHRVRVGTGTRVFIPDVRRYRQRTLPIPTP